MPRRRSASGGRRLSASQGLSARLGQGRTNEGTGGSRGREGAKQGEEQDPAPHSLLSSPPVPPVAAAAARLSQRNVGGTLSSPPP